MKTQCHSFVKIPELRATLLLVMLTVLASVCGCEVYHTYEIRQLVSMDRSLSSSLMQPLSEISDPALNAYADQILEYAGTARKKANTLHLPTDVALAYNDHLNAWTNFGNCVARHPEVGTFSSNFWKGFFRGLMGDVTGGYFTYMAAFDSWGAELANSEIQIQETWNTFTTVASKYGVTVEN